MKFRWSILITLALLAIAITGFLLLKTGQPAMVPQTVTLPNGTRFEFVEVTYGTNHVVGSPVARMIKQLPPFLQRILGPLGARLGPTQSRTTSKPALLLWYNCIPAAGNATYPATFMTDGTGFTSGNEATLFMFAGPTLYALEFQSFPRRSKMLQLQVLPEGNAIPSPGITRSMTLVVTNIPNPAFATFPQWSPEPLPSTKMAGDLEVTLSRFATGFGFRSASEYEDGKQITRFSRRETNGVNHSIFEVAFTQKGKMNAPWSVTQEMLSDATGNEVANSSMSGSGPGFYNVSPSLWPEESAWKLKLILKRNADFAINEQFTLTDIPVGTINQTNILAISTNFHGATITLNYFILRPALTNPNSWSTKDLSQLGLSKKGMPAGYHLDLIEARAGTNRLEVPGYGSSDTGHDYSFKNIPAGTKTIDLRFALHPSRSVEFLVKPIVGDPELTLDPDP